MALDNSKWVEIFWKCKHVENDIINNVNQLWVIRFYPIMWWKFELKPLIKNKFDFPVSGKLFFYSM